MVMPKTHVSHPTDLALFIHGQYTYWFTLQNISLFSRRGHHCWTWWFEKKYHRVQSTFSEFCPVSRGGKMKLKHGWFFLSFFIAWCSRQCQIAVLLLAPESEDLVPWAGKVRGGLERPFPLSSWIKMADSGAISRVERLGRTAETR